jgi:hypothetical protein
MDWIRLAKDRATWRALLSTAVNLLVPVINVMVYSEEWRNL